MVLPASTTLLHLRDEMLQYMEEDLMAKCSSAFAANGIAAHVHGVYSLDDLERKEREDLGQQIGVGCGYASCEAGEHRSGPSGREVWVKVLRYKFVVILAVPVDTADDRRHNATTLLTLLRRGIAGQTISGDRANRTWAFVSEQPRVAESTDTILYYAQVWEVALPQIGNQPS